MSICIFLFTSMAKLSSVILVRCLPDIVLSVVFLIIFNFHPMQQWSAR